MKLDFICKDCALEMTYSEYEGTNSKRCPECNGHFIENTEKVWCFTDKNGKLKGPFYNTDLRKAFLNKKIHEETDIFKLDTSETKPLKHWDSLKHVAKAAPPVQEKKPAIVHEDNTKKTLLVTCESCSQKFSKRAEACPKCGWKPKVMCKICQQKISFDSTVCPECGDPRPFELQEKTKQESDSADSKQTPGSSTFSSKSSEQKRESIATNSNANSQKFSMSWFLFSFDGRIGRQSFWCAYPVIFFFGLMLSVAIELIKESRNMNGLFIVGILTLILLWPSLAIQVKRWHDRNKSGNWILLNFIPIIGFLWIIIELGFLKGTEGNNDYGADPLSN